MMIDYLAIKVQEITALRESARRSLDSGRVSEAREHALRSRECINTLRAKVDPLPYPMLALDALSAAFVAEMEENALEKRKLSEAAIALLRNATDPGLLDPAVQSAGSEAEKAQLRELGRECSDRLEILTDRMMDASR
jgi:hypothetical protein